MRNKLGNHFFKIQQLKKPLKNVRLTFIKSENLNIISRALFETLCQKLEFLDFFQPIFQEKFKLLNYLNFINFSLL